MKFGKVLRETVRTRMPAWADYMVQYKALKQLLSQLAEAQEKPEAAGHGARSAHCQIARRQIPRARAQTARAAARRRARREAGPSCA